MSALPTDTLADLRAEVRSGAERLRKRTEDLLEEWFRVCDHLLDIHRSRFLVREPSAKELEEHEVALGECIQTSKALASQFSNSDESSTLLPRLQARIRQLQDAYHTFHDPSLSDQEADRILKQVFPE